MCNFCNVGRSTCGYGSFCGLANSLFAGSNQRVCRDACGNIHVSQCGSSTCDCCCQNQCDCNHRCCCQNSCSCDNENSGNGSSTGNGQFTCLTFCGNSATNATANASNDANGYYARQYGLYPWRSGCSCSGYNYGYTTTTQTT